MTASTPKGRARMLAEDAAIRNEGKQTRECRIDRIESAISQAVNAAIDEAAKICRDSCIETEEPMLGMNYLDCTKNPIELEQEILKLKAAYAKGEKGE